MLDYDAIVIGSGAGGGAIAYKLTKAGKSVVIIEAGGFYNTDQFNHFEFDALRKLWWEPRWTSNYERTHGKETHEISVGMGRCVGGSTTIFTAIAYRAFPANIEEWYEFTGVVNESGNPFSFYDIASHFETVESETGVRPYTNWDTGLQRMNQGFSKIGFKLETADAYITEKCDRNGCLFGCPTGAKLGSLLVYVIPSLYLGATLIPNSYVTEVLLRKQDLGRLEAYGVEYLDELGQKRRLTAKIVLLCAGALQTPQVLLQSKIKEKVGFTESSKQIGKNLAVNTKTIVFGRFSEELNNWNMHPISARLPNFALEKDGGFLLEMAADMGGPIGLAETLVDDKGVPMWGQELKSATKDYRYLAGILLSVHDKNDGSVELDENGVAKFYKPVTEQDLAKFSKGKELAKEGLFASGANRIYSTIFHSHHPQGSCRMGELTSKSAVNSNCELHDVSRLFVCDGSLIPCTLDVNPSLTIYALADRLSEFLVSEKCDYLK